MLRNSASMLGLVDLHVNVRWRDGDSATSAAGSSGVGAGVSDDSQDLAEALDEDKFDDIDDLSGDAFGDDLRDYPPDRPMGVNTVGVTAIEEDAGESLVERTLREEPDVL